VANLQIYVNVINYGEGTVLLEAVNETNKIREVISTSKLANHTKIAEYILQRMNSSSSQQQDQTRRGVYDITYHIAQVPDENTPGLMVDLPIVDNVDWVDLPVILRASLSTILSNIDGVVADQTVKDALKELAKGIYFLSRIN
jgi:hypothetical protein